MSKNFPEKNNVVTIKYFYALLTFLFLFFCDHKKIFILEKYLELLSYLYYMETLGNNLGKKWQKNAKIIIVNIVTIYMLKSSNWNKHYRHRKHQKNIIWKQYGNRKMAKNGKK